MKNKVKKLVVDQSKYEKAVDKTDHEQAGANTVAIKNFPIKKDAKKTTTNKKK